MKKLVRNLLSVALVAALVLSLGVIAFAADEKEPFEFKIDLEDKIEIEDVILQYVQDGKDKELSVKEVLTNAFPKLDLFKKLGGRVIAEAVAFDRYCNGFSYIHDDEETVAGQKGTVTFPAAPDGGINCPDMIQIPRDLIKEGQNYVAYVICIGMEDGELLTTGCAKLTNGALGDLVNLGNVAVKNGAAKIVITPDAVEALGAKNGDVIRIILGYTGKDGKPMERTNDHNFLVPKVIARQPSEPQEPTPAPTPDNDKFGRHGISIRSNGREIGLEAVPIRVFGFKVDRAVVPFYRNVEDNGKTELDVHAGMFQYVFDLFSPLESFLGYLK